ncbi:MAG: hypothetical protein CSA33_06585 [Desulfobulbus propionicus]|nr:MAG: hypothetical protein CSA33_06585 [Desulfobulbus propionicus]
MKRYFFIILMIPFFCLWGLAEQAVAIAQGPTEQLQPMISEITEILADASYSMKNNEDKVEQVMSVARQGFDFEEMSKRVLGSQWRSLSKEEKSQFTELFTELLKYAYVRQVDRYSGQRIEFLKERIRGRRAEVQTMFLDGSTQIPVSYILIQRGEKWLIYDVVVEGVSLIRNYLEQFQTIVRKEKFEGLMAQLEAKIAALKANPNANS